MGGLLVSVRIVDGGQYLVLDAHFLMCVIAECFDLGNEGSCFVSLASDDGVLKIQEQAHVRAEFAAELVLDLCLGRSVCSILQVLSRNGRSLGGSAVALHF